MLQYPTNIFPENIAIDSDLTNSDNKIEFTFNGDILSCYCWKIYDYNSGVKCGSGNYIEQWRVPLAFNGDTVTLSAPFKFDNMIPDTPLSAGDYVFQLMLCQATMDGTTELYDMFVLRGEVQQNYLTTDQFITIDSGISNIYEWDDISTDGMRRPTTIPDIVDPQLNWIGASMEIEIGNERRIITGYVMEDGGLFIDRAFSQNIPAGTRYQIYANYKVTPPYYFKVRNTPTATLTLEFSNPLGTVFHHITGTYSQTENSLIDHYKISLWKSYWDTTPAPSQWHKIDETENIYSQKIEADFLFDFDLHGQTSGGVDTYKLYYKATIDIITLDGMTISLESNVASPTNIDTAITPITPRAVVWDNDRADEDYDDGVFHQAKHCVALHADIFDHRFDDYNIIWYRENVNTNELSLVASSYYHNDVDVTVPTKGKFKYYAVPRTKTDMGVATKAVGTVEITLDMKGYSITELIPMEQPFEGSNFKNKKPVYKIGNQWKFVGEVKDTTVTQNTDKTLHVGYATYPTLTSTKTNYMTGSLSAMIGYVNCVGKKYVDDIDLIRAWRSFITKQSIYMLKSQKGDVWIVNITDAPSTTYEESTPTINTTFTFNWAECYNVNDLSIVYEPA